MAGGPGDDLYVLSAATDVVNETAPGSDGFDRVELAFTAAGGYTLPANVEDGRIGAGLARFLAGRKHVHGTSAPTNVAALAATLQPGDVILVEGDSWCRKCVEFLRACLRVIVGEM